MPQDRSLVYGDSDFLSRQQLLLANGWKLNQEKTGLKKSFTFENWTRCHVRYASDLLRLVAHIRESFADLVAVESWLEDHHALVIIVGHHYNRKKITMLTKHMVCMFVPNVSWLRLMLMTSRAHQHWHLQELDVWTAALNPDLPDFGTWSNVCGLWISIQPKDIANDIGPMKKGSVVTESKRSFVCDVANSCRAAR